MLENAQPEPSTPEFEEGDESEAALKQLADDVEEFIQNRISGPLGGKIAAYQILGHLMVWHSEIGKQNFADGDTERGAAWLRDAGILQAAMGNLRFIDLGPNDFLCHGEE